MNPDHIQEETKGKAPHYIPSKHASPHAYWYALRKRYHAKSEQGLPLTEKRMLFVLIVGGISISRQCPRWCCYPKSS